MARFAGTSRRQAMSRDTSIVQSPPDVLRPITVSTMIPPRADDKPGAFGGLQNGVIIFCADGFLRGFHICWVGRTPSEEIEHVHTAVLPVTGVIDAPADGGVVDGLGGGRWIESDERTVRTARIPNAPQCVAPAPAGTEFGPFGIREKACLDYHAIILIAGWAIHENAPDAALLCANSGYAVGVPPR